MTPMAMRKLVAIENDFARRLEFCRVGELNFQIHIHFMDCLGTGLPGKTDVC